MTLTDVLVLASITSAPMAVTVAVLHFAGKPGRPLAPKPPYQCARCDKPRMVYSPLARCAPCEEVVTDIIFDAAAQGIRVEDPLAARRFGQKF
ncbi:hypothetical protein ACWDX6_23860 [Streptomyces sp. NPDC003027]